MRLNSAFISKKAASIGAVLLRIAVVTAIVLWLTPSYGLAQCDDYGGEGCTNPVRVLFDGCNLRLTCACQICLAVGYSTCIPADNCGGSCSEFGMCFHNYHGQ
jgi:hypothetical protein